MSVAGALARILALLAALAAGGGALAQVERLAADEIAPAVAGRTLTGYWLNAQVKQFFGADGAALRQQNRDQVAAGRWWVDEAGALLCTEYPDADPRRCFRLQRQSGKLVLFEAETGYPLHATVLPGNLLAGIAGGTAAGDVGQAPPGATRTRLTLASLLAAQPADGGVLHNGHFLAIGATAPIREPLSGRLTVPDFALQGRIELGRGYEWFPGFETAIYSDGEALVPAERGLLRGPGSKSQLWVALSPGRVWREPADGPWSRAALPFLLANPAQASAHNGIATFLFDGARVSRLRVQVTQEISAGYKLDAWGQTAMAFAAGPVDAAALAAFRAERAAALPLKPWADLPGGLAAPEEMTGPEVSAAGLVLDGTVYLLPCETRAGPLPFCAAARHDGGEMAASFAAGLSLLYLAQALGDWVLDQRIAALLPAARAAEGWERVTFTQALNMASGIGRPAPPNMLTPERMHARHAREAPSLAEKLAWAFKDAPGPAAPGEAFHLRESDTLVLAAAMDAFWKRERGDATADLWRTVAEAVLRPAGIAHLPLARTVEADGRPGIPPMTGGLYPDVDDLAKLTRLLQAGGGPALHAPPLARLLDFAAGKGLETGIAGRRYFMSFWLWPYEAAGGCRLWLPVVSGGIGQLAVLLPGGIAAFRFADDHRLPVEAMARTAERLRPFCP